MSDAGEPLHDEREDDREPQPLDESSLLAALLHGYDTNVDEVAVVGSIRAYLSKMDAAEEQDMRDLGRLVHDLTYSGLALERRYN